MPPPTTANSKCSFLRNFPKGIQWNELNGHARPKPPPTQQHALCIAIPTRIKENQENKSLRFHRQFLS